MTYLSSAELNAIAAVACPTCKAQPGTPCGGKATPRRAPHPDRVTLAERQRRERLKLETWNQDCQ